MIYRMWMDDKTQNELDKVAITIPSIVIEHALNLIEEMDKENDKKYRCKLVHFMWQAASGEEEFTCHCSNAAKYDIFHEFCIYLEGWLWYFDFEDGDSKRDSEHSWIYLKRLNDRPLA